MGSARHDCICKTAIDDSEVLCRRCLNDFERALKRARRLLSSDERQDCLHSIWLELVSCESHDIGGEISRSVSKWMKARSRHNSKHPLFGSIAPGTCTDMPQRRVDGPQVLLGALRAYLRLRLDGAFDYTGFFWSVLPLLDGTVGRADYEALYSKYYGHPMCEPEVLQESDAERRGREEANSRRYERIRTRVDDLRRHLLKHGKFVAAADVAAESYIKEASDPEFPPAHRMRFFRSVVWTHGIVSNTSRGLMTELASLALEFAPTSRELARFRTAGPLEYMKQRTRALVEHVSKFSAQGVI